MKKISGNPFLKNNNGEILIDAVPFKKFTSKFKTPLLIFLENRIKNNIRTFINVFSSEFKNFSCYYSFKANYLPEICNIVRSEGVGAEIVGLPELRLALKLGFSPDKIIIGGPYLPEELIDLSIKSKVKEIIVYNITDLKKINFYAHKYNVIQDVCLRINSQKYGSKLGIRLEETKLLLLEKLIETLSNIYVTSILSHYSTQMNNVDQFKSNLKSIVENLKLLLKHGIKIENLNLGGGFPEATVMPQEQLRNVAIQIKSALDESAITYKNIYFEPGRYFIGDAGFFITKIVKTSDYGWTFLDIGNHICPKFARCSLRFYNASHINEPHKYITSFAGIVPTDQDVLAKNYFFTEEIREGDFVIVTNTGAYCLTFSNRFPYYLPTILLIKDDYYTLIFNPNLDNDISITSII
jgi:diaminopimelate decarboxylase